MIRQIIREVELSEESLDLLEDLKPFRKSDWDNKTLNDIKEDIRAQLLDIQDEDCPYCGLDLGGTSSNRHIEHIAPKSTYPQFLFTPNNLALACQYCNGFEKKGSRDTISILQEEYDVCEFYLVHPYHDDPDDHYDWEEEDRRVLIIGTSDKGRWTINLFKLDSAKMTELRGKKILVEEMMNKRPDESSELIKRALEYKGRT